MTIRITRARAAVAMAVLGIVVAGASYAAIPSANGTISACKDTKGALKVIDTEAGQACNANQQLLTWNQQGPAGAQGAPGVSGYEIVYAQTGSISADGTWKVAYADCPAGKKPLGGGGGAASNVPVVVSNSAPFPNGGGWKARLTETTPIADTWTGEAFAICAYVG